MCLLLRVLFFVFDLCVCVCTFVVVFLFFLIIIIIMSFENGSLVQYEGRGAEKYCLS